MSFTQQEFFVLCMSYKIGERFIYITLLQKYCICCIVTWLSPTLGAFSALSPSPDHIHSSGITNSIHLFLKRIYTKAKNYFHIIHRKAIIYNALLARNRKRTLGYLRKSLEIYVQQQEEYIRKSESHRDYSITKRMLLNTFG